MDKTFVVFGMVLSNIQSLYLEATVQQKGQNLIDEMQILGFAYVLSASWTLQICQRICQVVFPRMPRNCGLIEEPMTGVTVPKNSKGYY